MSAPRTDAHRSEFDSNGRDRISVSDILGAYDLAFSIETELADEREKVAKLRDALSAMLFPAGAFTRHECEKLLADTAPKEDAK